MLTLKNKSMLGLLAVSLCVVGARALTAAPKVAQDVPDAQSSAEYTIEPPDVIEIVASGWPKEMPQGLCGKHLVRPDGTVALGVYGQVMVAGRSPDQAQQAISNQLARFVKEKPGAICVSVVGYHSKVFYLITARADGDQVQRLPLTGIVTVADVICREQLETFAVTAPLWIKRESGVVVRVNRHAIAYDRSALSYTLGPRDQLYIGHNGSK